MKSTSYSIAIAAIVLAASLAGVAVMADDAGAEGAVEVQYNVDGTFTKATVTDGAFTVESRDGVLYWTYDGGRYYAGQYVDVSDMEGVMELVAVTEDDGTDYATVGIRGVSYVIPVADGALDTKDVAYKDASEAYQALKDAGYSVDWDPADPFADGTEVSADAEYVLTTGIGKVIWMMDGTTKLGESAVEDGVVGIHDAPSRESYTFAGWSLSVGGDVVIEYIASTGAYWGEGVDGDAENGYTVSVADTDSDTGSVVFYAVFQPNVYTVTFVAGDEVVATMLVAHGSTVSAVPEPPDGYAGWDFDASAPITGDVTVEALLAEDLGIYTVTFVVDGAVLATYNSDAITLPTDPVKDGYTFVGWYIGTERIADPVSYTYTGDTVLTAGFEAVVTETAEVAYTHADGTVEVVTVPVGQALELPAAGEGNVWACDGKVYEGAAVTGDMALTEVREFYTVTYTIDGLTFATEQVRYGELAEDKAYEREGYDGWAFDFAAPIYADVTIDAAPEVVVEEPGWLDSTVNKLALIVIVLFIVLALGWFMYLRAQNRLTGKLARFNKDNGSEE